MSRKEQWSTYATTVEAGFQESIDWIKSNCQGSVDHHNILAGWCLSLSQRFLLMFTKVCDGLSNQLTVKHFDYLTAMIGLDAVDKYVFNRCVQHKSPEGDLYGDQIFTLVGMEMTLDCKTMMSGVQFNLWKLCKQATILHFQQLDQVGMSRLILIGLTKRLTSQN